jgi:hypothetical protein
MVSNRRPPATAWLFGREVLWAFLVVVGLVAVAPLVPVQVVQLPGYLLILGSDLIQNPLLPGLGGLAHTAFFALYLYAVAVVVGNLYRWGRSLRARRSCTFLARL